MRNKKRKGGKHTLHARAFFLGLVYSPNVMKRGAAFGVYWCLLMVKHIKMKEGYLLHVALRIVREVPRHPSFVAWHLTKDTYNEFNPIQISIVCAL